MEESKVEEPFPISLVGGRYLLFDVDAISHIRREHHICGILIGNIPQANQQNVFNGVPLELMSEEVRLLVTKRHAFIVDDAAQHSAFFRPADAAAQAWHADLKSRGMLIATESQKLREEGKAVWKEKIKAKGKRRPSKSVEAEDSSTEVSMFSPDTPPASKLANPKPVDPSPFSITPTTSYPPLNPSAQDPPLPAPAPTTAYPVFEHLHSKGYFMTAGLRFGCNYTVYPGDPLRFHSHFLATGKDWDEPINLMDIVAGGRLGTGVKKSYLLGGPQPSEKSAGDSEARVRTFSVEWAAM